MATTQYAYLTIKIPGPKGVIIGRADIARAVASREDILVAETDAEPSRSRDPETSTATTACTRLVATDEVPTKSMSLDKDGKKSVTIVGGLDSK